MCSRCVGWVGDGDDGARARGVQGEDVGVDFLTEFEGEVGEGWWHCV